MLKPAVLRMDAKGVRRVSSAQLSLWRLQKIRGWVGRGREEGKEGAGLWLMQHDRYTFGI